MLDLPEPQGGLDPYSVIRAFSATDCSDIRDRVFAVRMVMSDPTCILDYNLSAIALFSHLVKSSLGTALVDPLKLALNLSRNDLTNAGDDELHDHLHGKPKQRLLNRSLSLDPSWNSRSRGHRLPWGRVAGGPDAWATLLRWQPCLSLLTDSLAPEFPHVA
ncbi:uncharacterized protein PV07_10394 [Cladophialophora immunda]|uniref:Uncharacterized protein n=1 Tax=Cladophialophora immunda TaxID=569365 RepID=A0A0D2C003_9EURO|nr:uncharacterized protein PV07_10394 [Cladophialophora immunda]KIW24693.1 hypothetical protein PV07_10394 [Cladophialophora immunda]